jgi:hypothetical protein
LREIIYVLQFKGAATDVEGAAGVRQATSVAAAARITTTIDGDGVKSSIEALDGPAARLESKVVLTSPTDFQESGTIRFGDAGSLMFSTVGSGYRSRGPEEGWVAGVVMWRVDGGEGKLAGAQGYITSNFKVNSLGEVVDNHVGVIYVP